MFQGFTPLEDDMQILVQAVDSDDAPIDADAPPTYRVYGQSGVVYNGTAAFLQSGDITGATNDDPIVITSAAHQLVTGSVVTIASVGGNTNANGTWVVTVLDDDTFSIPNAGNSAYTSGGTWHCAGLYTVSFTASAANGFASGNTYTCLTNWTVSDTNQDQLDTFCVT